MSSKTNTANKQTAKKNTNDKNSKTAQSEAGKGKGKSAQKEESVEQKEKKPSKYAGVEKGDAPNLATAFAGLHLNVETVKKWLKSYYEDYKVERKAKSVKSTIENPPTKKGGSKNESVQNSEPKVMSEKVMLNNANFALGAVEHSLCLGLVGLIYGKSKKAGAGLYTLYEQDLLASIDANLEYKFTFGRLLYLYQTKMDYVTQLGFNKKELSAYIEQYGFTGGNTTVNINGVLNLIAFLMLQNRNLLAETAYWSTIAKKGTTVTDRSILCAIPVTYQGQLKDTLYRKCEDVMLKISGVSSTDDSESGSKKGSKQGSKKVAQVVNDDENDEDGDDEDGDDEDGDDEDGDDEDEDDEDEDEDEEPVPEPPKKTSNNKNSNNGKKQTSSKK